MAKQIINPETLILETAKKILLDGGYDKLNMRNVAKECGIATGSIYNYYPTKSELIVAMMTEYWDDFFVFMEEIESLPFFDSLHSMFFKLEDFVKVFREVWLKPDLYKSKDSVNKGVKKEHEYLFKIQLFIEKKLIEEFPNNLEEISPREFSTFIISNFMSMLQNKRFSYESFEKIIKKLLK